MYLRGTTSVFTPTNISKENNLHSRGEIFRVDDMKKRCWVAVLALFVFMILGIRAFFWHLNQQVTSPVLATQKIDSQKIAILMRYHGTKIAKLKGGRWYFLAPGGRWLPLETQEACRYLTAKLPSQKNAPCL